MSKLRCSHKTEFLSLPPFLTILLLETETGGRFVKCLCRFIITEIVSASEERLEGQEKI